MQIIRFHFRPTELENLEVGAIACELASPFDNCDAPHIGPELAPPTLLLPWLPSFLNPGLQPYFPIAIILINLGMYLK